ncbi:PREDICTED: fibrous sheath-interacting protein 1, partial [Tinamus guttatus]|uniref:fibrous sheath-interacting protein 1 n=1 Tax=Tinamus guttatus TaxID=94827 RepID=UPI00052F21F1
KAFYFICFSGSLSNSDSGDDSAEKTSKLSEPSQAKKITNSSNLEDSEQAGIDPLIEAAIRKMNKLDTILAKKHLKERAIKKQGKEMRAKLWEELQSVSTSGSHEEIENTKHFLALISSWQDTAEPFHVKEDEICISVFHTQINPEDYDCHKSHHNHDCPKEIKTNEFLNLAEKTHNKSKSSQDFIKKNIELAKDSGNQVALLEEEKKRLIELLKDTGDGSELQGLEEDASSWLVPGEGYTPEPMEFHHLSEIDVKLQVLSNGHFSTSHSSCSKPPRQIYQESLAYANRKLEAVPGEKVLRYNKEHRDQQNRLKEIDNQLKSLEESL